MCRISHIVLYTCSTSEPLSSIVFTVYICSFSNLLTMWNHPVCVHTHMCMCICVCVCVLTSMWMSTCVGTFVCRDQSCHWVSSSITRHITFYTRSRTEPGVHKFCSTPWPASPQDPPARPPWHWYRRWDFTISSFCMGAREPNSRLLHLQHPGSQSYTLSLLFF